MSSAVRLANSSSSCRARLTPCSCAGLVGEIIGRFEKRGYKLVAMKLASPSVEHLEKHYEDLKEKPFFKGLVSYMASGELALARAGGGSSSWRIRRLALPAGAFRSCATFVPAP